MNNDQVGDLGTWTCHFHRTFLLFLRKKVENLSHCWSVLEFWTRLKCKYSARVKIVLKKDWIVNNVEKMLKKCKKN